VAGECRIEHVVAICVIVLGLALEVSDAMQECANARLWYRIVERTSVDANPFIIREIRLIDTRDEVADIAVVTADVDVAVVWQVLVGALFASIVFRRLFSLLPRASAPLINDDVAGSRPAWVR